MKVITFASSKGGAGKTTSAIVLASTLAKLGQVVLLDADPAHRLMSWSSKGKLPVTLKVVASQGERHIHDEIEHAKSIAQFVIIDLEGAASRINAYAMMESDLVIIPMGDEQPDAEGAIETLAQLALEARALRRDIPVRILFARTQAAVKSRLAKSLNTQVRTKIGSFQTELHTRTAFAALHHFGGTLYSMNQDEVTGVDKAINNAELLGEEVLQALGWVEQLRAETKSRSRPFKNLKRIQATSSSEEVSHDVT